MNGGILSDTRIKIENKIVDDITNLAMRMNAEWKFLTNFTGRCMIL